MQILNFNILGVQLQARCPDQSSHDLLLGCYSAFLNEDSSRTQLHYEISLQANGGYRLAPRDGQAIDCADDYDLMYFFEKNITLEIQKIRTDLLFLHGGALEFQGKCCIFTAPSGSGKSTTTWAALHHGFNYMSDELAPIVPGSNEVACYPHALCLKHVPPAPYDLPPDTVRTNRTLHIPVTSLPSGTVLDPMPLAAVFFVRYDSAATAPQIRPVSTAECGARLYSNALNLLCHSRYGLDVVVAAAAGCSGFELITNDLASSCELVKQTLSG